MIDYQECRRVLVSPELANAWNEILADYPDHAMESEAYLRQWVGQERDETVALIDDVADFDTSALHLGLRLIELRTRWSMLNTRLNFRMMKGAECDMAMAVRASLISSLIDAIETVMEDEDLAVITQFLGSPVLSESVGSTSG